MALLQDYDRRGSDAAFATLVQRQVNLVYSVALRHAGTPAQAEEITQAVFIILARKAGSLRPDTILEGWLHGVTRLTALRFLRGERRRQFREQEAYMQSTPPDASDASAWNQLAPSLDEALSSLGQQDRDAVVLRFLKEKNLNEVASAMNTTEAAAQRRVHRAVEKLRTFFARRGLRLSALALTTAITANSVQSAPVGLAAAVATAVLSGTTITTTAILAATKTIAMTTLQKTLVTVVLSVLAGAGIYEARQSAQLRQRNELLRQQVDQMGRFATENQNLSNLLAQAIGAESLAKNQLDALLRQRVTLPETNGLAATTRPLDALVSPAIPAAVPELPTNSWRNAGFATPQAALQTRGWAVLNGDRDVFRQSVYITDGARKIMEDHLVEMASTSTDPDTPRLIQQALNEKWGMEDAVLMPLMALNQQNTFTGYRILSQQSPSPADAILQVETDMATAPPATETLKFQHIGNDWKVVIDEGVVRQEIPK